MKYTKYFRKIFQIVKIFSIIKINAYIFLCIECELKK